MRVGVIGLGSIGMRHVRNLEMLGHAVVGHDPIISGSVPRMSIDDMKTQCDAVVIASPTNTHFHYLQQFVEAGVSTLVEKPVADGEQLKVALVLSLAREKKIPVFVGFNLRFHACVKMTKEWLDEGLIGKPLWAGFCVAQQNSRPEYRRVGVALNWLSHEVDLALHLFGPADFVHAFGDDRNMVDMMIKHRSGVQTMLHGNYLANPEMRDYRIVGESGNIIVDLAARWATIAVGDYRNRFDAEDNWDENYLQEMAAFMGDGKGLATGADGLYALQLCLSAREGAGG